MKLKLLLTVLSVITAFAGGSLTAATAKASVKNYTVQTVHSNAMNKNIQVGVLKANPGAPTLILLDGLRALDNNSGWVINTDILNYFSDKNVNVILPFGGAGTYYSDWVKDDPKLGKVKWETFLTKELVNYLNGKKINTTNSAIAGISMAGSSALTLAAHHKNLYKAAASLSGYPSLLNPAMQVGIGYTVSIMGGNANNMWGGYGSAEWKYNNPRSNISLLKGTDIYVSAGGGWPSIADVEKFLRESKKAEDWATGGLQLEQISSASNVDFLLMAKLGGVNVETHLTTVGYHTWSYWQDEIKRAWETTLSPALSK